MREVRFDGSTVGPGVRVEMAKKKLPLLFIYLEQKMWAVFFGAYGVCFLPT